MPNQLKAKYRVAVNPTGENYGVTGSAKLFTEHDALQTFLTFADHLEANGTAKGFVILDDEPQFGGESSGVLLRKSKGKRVTGFDTWITAFTAHLHGTRHGTVDYEPQLAAVPDVDPLAHTLTVNDDDTVTVEFDGWYTIDGVSHYASVDDLDTNKTRIVFRKENL